MSFGGIKMKRKIISLILFIIIIMLQVFQPICLAIVDNFNAYNANENDILTKTNTYGNYEYTINENNEVVITKYNGSETTIVIPSTIQGYEVTEIGQSAFAGCYNLVNVTLPDSISRLQGFTFYQCASLQNVNLGNSITSIGTSEFRHCPSLKNINIPDSVKSIGAHAFAECDNLEEVVLGNSITEIKSNAFQFCSKLSSINLPETLTTIGKEIFYNCSSLKSIEIPCNLSQKAFASCVSLESIVLGENVKIIGPEAFKYCTKLTNVTIPETVTSIVTDAFANCKNLETITILNNSIELDRDVFRWTDDVTIYCYENSNAHKYAVENNINFVIIKDNGKYAYAVTFKDYNGNILKTDIVENGEEAIAPENPTREGYKFIGWDKSFNNITSSITVTAQYQINTYDVVFKDYDGRVLKTQKVEYGKNATAPSAPIREGYTFTGWDKVFTNVSDNITITAQYTKIDTYDVIFKDYDGRILKTQKVEKGKSAIAPESPIREGYTFIGWDKNFDNVVENIEVIAQYEKNEVEQKLPFTDIKNNVFYSNALEYMYRNGYITGTGKTTFSPNDKLSRAMLVTILWNMEGKIKTDGINKFPDVKNGVWYTDAIIWASSNGVVNGNKDGSFAPNANITRQEVAVMLANYAKYKGFDISSNKDLNTFKDSNKVAIWANSAVKWAIENKVISGAENGTKINPILNATRAEATTMLKNYIDNVK